MENWFLISHILKLPGTLQEALCFIISEFCGKYRHIPGIFHDYWWPLLSSRPSFGHLFQRCSSTPLVGENQAGAKKAASPSGGLKIFRGQMSGAMSARRSKSRGWGFLCPELPVAFPFWINHLSFYHSTSYAKMSIHICVIVSSVPKKKFDLPWVIAFLVITPSLLGLRMDPQVYTSLHNCLLEQF